MKFNKKITSLFAALALSATFMVGCGSNDDADKDDNNTPVEQNKEAEENNEVDGFSGATESDSPSALVEALEEDGNWIFAATGDITVDETLVVDGTFYNKNDGETVYRKLALYTQDDDRNVEDEFTLTVSEMIVKTPNFTIVHGTVVGDIVVEAEGFTLNGVTVEGNITFASEEIQDSADIDADSTVTGEMTVAE